MKELIFKGIKRRKKEIRYVSLVTFLAVLFMTGITLLQDVMDNYLYEKNLNTYGNWIVSTVDKKFQHPYFLLESSVKIGANITDKDGVPMELWVGTVDENFDLVDGEIFYEGRMPQNDFEIAMDSSSLSLLGYTYDVGQTITFSYWDASGTLCTKAYELVGVTKSIDQIWRVTLDYALPSIFVTETELKASQPLSTSTVSNAGYPIFNRNTDSYTVTFYQLNPEYKTIDAKTFANSFKGESEAWCFNTFVYESGVWDSAEIFQIVSYSFMVVSALAMGYLLIAYMGKRRSVYYKYRTLGASKRQVRKIILLECMYGTLPQIVLGIATSYIIAFLACSIVSMQQNMPSFYHFNTKLFAEHIVVSVAIVLLSIFGAILSINDNSLAGNMKTIKPSQYNRIRKIALKTRFPERAIFQRKRKIKPIQTICQAMFSIVVCGCLLFCVFKMEDSISEAKWAFEQNEFMFRERAKLYTFDVREEKRFVSEGIESVSFGKDMYDMYHGAQERILQEVLMCSGVKSIEYGWLDERHYFTWEDMENSTLIKWLKENGEAEEDCPVTYGMGMQFYEELSTIQQEVKPLQELQNVSVDWESVKNGEAVIILYHSPNDEDGIEVTGIKEDSLRANDMITIRDFENQIEVPVKIAAIFDCTEMYPSDIEHGMTYVWFDNYTVLGMKELAEKIANTEGKELTISFIDVKYETTASYISIDKQLATLANRYDVKYASQAEEHELVKNQTIIDMGIYGSMFFMLLCIYILIQRNILITKETYWKNQYMVLKQIGMEEAQYRRLCFMEECKSYLWLFGGFIPGYTLIYYYHIIGWTDRITGFFIDWTPQQAFEFVLKTPHMLMLIIVAMIYLLMVLCLSMIIRKSVKGGNI